MTTSHVITLTCADRPGIMHAVTAGVLDIAGNVVENEQFTDPDSSIFCMRTVVDVDDHVEAAAVHRAVADRLGDGTADLRVRPAAHRPRVMIMVSKHDHCLVDLLYRWRNNGLPVHVEVIVSNHPDCAPIAAAAGVDFVHLPVSRETKPAQESQVKELVAARSIDIVVLARYMQILSDDLCDFLAGRAINIHHSFLPGFKGAKPYHQAHDRGVKLVGATAHFVTADLDEGPIIEQEVTRVTHAHTAEQLVALGQDTERLVLARAVRAVADDRVFLIGDRTVVFP